MKKKYKESDIPNGKQYPGKIKRLAISLFNHGMAWEDALAFIKSAEGIQEADKKGMAFWFHENLPKLEKREDYKSICEGCACCLGGKRAEFARAIRKEETLEARIEKLSQNPYIIGDHLERIDDKSFKVCFAPAGLTFYRCPCLRFEEGKQPCDMQEGYCYCCGGHIKAHVSKALGVEIEVEPISSSLMSKGKEGCIFKVTILG